MTKKILLHPIQYYQWVCDNTDDPENAYKNWSILCYSLLVDSSAGRWVACKSKEEFDNIPYANYKYKRCISEKYFIYAKALNRYWHVTKHWVESAVEATSYVDLESNAIVIESIKTLTGVEAEFVEAKHRLVYMLDIASYEHMIETFMPDIINPTWVTECRSILILDNPTEVDILKINAMYENVEIDLAAKAMTADYTVGVIGINGSIFKNPDKHNDIFTLVVSRSPTTDPDYLQTDLELTSNIVQCQPMPLDGYFEIQYYH